MRELLLGMYVSRCGVRGGVEESLIGDWKEVNATILDGCDGLSL